MSRRRNVIHRLQCSKQYAYGIAFCGKLCEVGGGKLRAVQATASETGFPGREDLSSGAPCGIR